MSVERSLTLLLPLALVACGGNRPEVQNGDDTDVAAASLEGVERPDDDNGRCQTDGSDREVSEYDTSGDDYPDVRRVFRRVGDPPVTRLIMICREVDLNADGTKDIVRYYTDEGRPLREEADRDFDGRMDSVTYYQEGRVMRRELDTTGNGRVDTKIFFDDGEMVRTERDLAGRSTATEWRPDNWEYFDGGEMVRMGTDIDGDGSVDRWDRDSAWLERRAAERAREEAEAQEAVDAVGDDGADEGGEG